jgi:hypothetical protein
MEDDGVLALLKAFKTSRMGYLEILDLDRNVMTDKVLVELAKVLEADRYLPSLHTLRLGPTHLTSTSARAFVAAYQRNKSLTVEITFLDWPNAYLRDSAERFRSVSKVFYMSDISYFQVILALLFPFLNFHDRRVSSCPTIYLL